MNLEKKNLKRQIYYLLTKFSANDSNLIKGFDIMANKTQSKEIIIVFRCVDNEIYERSVDLNKKYLLNLKKLKSIIIDICKLVKKNIGYNFKEKNEDFLFRNNNVIRMPGMNNMNSTNISKLLKSNISNVKPASKSLNENNNNNKNNTKSDLTSVKLDSDPVIPLSQLDSNASSIEISKNSSSESSNKKAKVKLFGNKSKTKKSSKKINNNDNEELSQGFRRLDPKKPLDINKGLNELIQGVELEEENRNSRNNSNYRRTRRKSRSRGRSRTRRNSRDRRTRKKSRSRNRYRVI